MATWETTNIPNLLKNAASGRYYGRFTVSGKQKWVNLKTDVWSIAKIRLAIERSTIERGRKAVASVKAGEATMGELFAIYRGRVEDRADLRPKSMKCLLGPIETVAKTWPGLSEMAPDNVTREAVIEWRNRVARDGTGYTPPGVSKSSKRVWGRSSSTINQCIDAIRRALDIAADQGQLSSNPLSRRGVKVKNHARKPNLPDSAKLQAVFDEMDCRGRRPGVGCESADLCRFLAYTGCRLSEAQGVKWADVDFAKGIIGVHGTKTEAANREVPMIPAARALLEKIRARRLLSAREAADGIPVIDPAANVLGIGGALKPLAKACRKVGVEVLNHHDLRDAFATASIEAGVDIPTVAAWLGHADGGALLMKVYTHHRRPHSLEQAARVTFGA